MPLPSYLPPLLVGLGACAAAAVLHATGWLQPLDLWAYDRGVALRADAGATEDRVVLVRAREPDLAETGWPLSDRQLAELIGIVAEAGPAAIGVDIYRDRPVAPGEDALRALLERHRDVLWVHQFTNDAGRSIPPPAPLVGTDRTGFADLVTDPDGLVRRGLLYVADGEGRVAAGLGMAMALRLLERGGVAPEPAPRDPEGLRLGAATLAPLRATDGAYGGAHGGIDDRGFQVMLDYALGPEPFRSFSMLDALGRRIPPEALAGRLVLVAVTAESVRDDFRAPVGGFTYGAVLHAQTASQVIRLATGEAKPLSSLADGAELALIAAAGLAGGLVALRLRGALAYAGVAAGGTAVLVGLWYAALSHRLWLPAAGPVAAWLGALSLVIAYVSLREKADREAMMQLFSIHVAAPIARELWRDRAAFMTGGRPQPQRLTATVLFSDVAGFTPISERLDPETLNDWLHAYMDAMVPIVLGHGGLVMSFLGDGIFAVFGVPVARGTEAEIRRDAAQAVRAALAMEPALDALNRRWEREGLPPVRIRVGIHTGSMVAGSIGGAGHMEYTLIGDAVNTAARLEALAKTVEETDRPIRIVVGASTWDRLDGAFLGRAIGEVALKGKDQRVAVHLILGPRDAGAEDASVEDGGAEDAKQDEAKTPGRVARLTAAGRPPPDTGDADLEDRPLRKREP